jgi:hypothetical protein
MSKKVYNLFLTSSNVFQTNSATRDLVYAVDWSFLPDNKGFNVTCRFSSSDINVTASCMGAITWDVMNSYSYTGSSTTPKNMTPVYIPARPNANLLRIRLVNANALNDLLTTFPGSVNAASPAVYILMLNFEECD